MTQKMKLSVLSSNLSAVAKATFDPSGLILFTINLLLPVLQSFIKNPKSLAAERVILTTLRDTINQILAGIPAKAAKR